MLAPSQKNTTVSFPTSLSPGRAVHPHLTLASGSKCSDSAGLDIENLRSSTEIEFICDPSVAVGAASAVGAGSDLGMNVRVGRPWLVAQLPPRDNKAGSLTLLTLYPGTLYNYFALGFSRRPRWAQRLPEPHPSIQP
ncbi:hypothetical protein B0H14DRAFT_3484983 [Mycena olivaceomarginata]|nr:hypothetical protein B0H14DRAFT_3484983 [Mycena olivaceomarginata]